MLRSRRHNIVVAEPKGDEGVFRTTISLLGTPRIEHNGAPVEVDTRKAIALAAYLAVTKQSHTRDALAPLYVGPSRHWARPVRRVGCALTGRAWTSTRTLSGLT